MSITKHDNGNLPLRFAVSQGSSMAAVDNVTWEWRQLVEKLSVSITDPLTLAQFSERSKDWQNARKQSGGYFIGGQMAGHRRDMMTMKERQLLTYDIDAGDARLLRDLREGRTGLGACEYVVHSTRTHGGDAMKLRVIVPLLKLLPKENFQAVARVGAWNLDCNMEAVDPVSFRPAQIMYWPAHCKDVEPIFIHHRGPLLDVQRMLQDWGGNDTRWRDIGALPRSPRQDRMLHANMGRMHQDPTTKRGMVGAMCSTWDVYRGMAEFLSDIYAPSQYAENGLPSRYSYMPGTSGNGVEVFESGHIMSHHGSDPISEMNLNIFDAVRIHKFGHLDKPGEEGNKDPRQLASYKAMATMLAEYPEYVEELHLRNYGMDPADLADTSFEAEPPPASAEPEVTSKAKADPKWINKLRKNEAGTIKSTYPNIVLILRHSDTFRGKLGYNEFSHVPCFVESIRLPSIGVFCLIPAGSSFTPIENPQVNDIRLILEANPGSDKTGWGLQVSKRDLEQAIDKVCRENKFHPVRDHLGWMIPKNKSLLEQLWIKTCHTPDTPYFRTASRNFLIASVARIYTPGTKFDFMPVLVGLTGIRKSTMVRVLGTRAWSTESEGHYDNKQKFVEASMGFWFVEHGEMTHFRRAGDEEAIKAMLSGTFDTIRRPYRPEPETLGRQFVMIGTTEDTQFLRSYHRRIWPIPCGDRVLDIEWLEANREQLFAEAIVAWRELLAAGHDPYLLPLDLRGEAEVEFGKVQAKHQIPDEAEAKAGIVREFLDAVVPADQAKPGWDVSDATDAALDDEAPKVRRIYTCGLEIFSRALGGDASKYDRRTAQSMGEIMKYLQDEWKPDAILTCGKWGRQRTYRRSDD